MKKFLILTITLLTAVIFLDVIRFDQRLYFKQSPHPTITSFITTSGPDILLRTEEDTTPFEIRGVDLGSGLPGHWSTDFAISKDRYLRWFEQIQQMGANTIRVYSVQSSAFYDAFYEYNHQRETPLFLLQGVWVNDYVQNSHRNAWDEDFYDTFAEDCRTAVDIVHGKFKFRLNNKNGYGFYHHDISPWVIGYLLGPEWNSDTVAFTDEQFRGQPAYTQYQGDYLYTTEDASPFETMLTKVGDRMIEYETQVYGQQRLLSFTNGVSSDPFVYPDYIAQHFNKYAIIDTEHIRATDAFTGGLFASYHVYPGYPDYLHYISDWEQLGIPNRDPFRTASGLLNTYRAYLSMLTAHHSVPVVIAEFGVSTGRGQTSVGFGGSMSEYQQGKLLLQCYEDIRATGCAGCCIATWQDEWHKRTWNTIHAINMARSPYWSDVQSAGQFYGLMAMEPGDPNSIVCVDGDSREWANVDPLLENESGKVFAQYDPRYLYLMIQPNAKKPLEKPLYLPFDITPKTGSYFCENKDLRFDRPVDFLLVLDGQQNSRLLVQQRYEALRATYAQNVYGINAYEKSNVPDVDTPLFVPIRLLLQHQPVFHTDEWVPAKVCETGKLTYGNANPESPVYNSLSDFCAGEHCIEIRLPWQLLNFSDPSKMTVHDDYYDGNYGIEHLSIDKIGIGLTDGSVARAELVNLSLSGWDEHVTYHERLKTAYGMIQKRWGGISDVR